MAENSRWSGRSLAVSRLAVSRRGFHRGTRTRCSAGPNDAHDLYASRERKIVSRLLGYNVSRGNGEGLTETVRTTPVGRRAARTTRSAVTARHLFDIPVCQGVTRHLRLLYTHTINTSIPCVRYNTVREDGRKGIEDGPSKEPTVR